MNDLYLPQDLRGDNEKKVRMAIPIYAAVATFIILVSAGIVIGSVMPGLLEADEVSGEENDLDRGLDVFLTSTFDRVTTEKVTYENVPVPAAFELLFLEGNGNEDNKVLHPQVQNLLEFIFTNSSAINIIVSPGSGWDMNVAPYEHRIGDMTEITKTISREVTVGSGGMERTIFISIDILQEVSN